MVQDYWTCNHAKALKDFGFKQEVSIEEGIQDTIDWYRRMKWL